MINEEIITKIGKLSRTKLSDEEKSHFAAQLNGVLNWVEVLQEVNTDGVEEMTSVIETTLSWRKDEVADGGIQEEILKNAPESEYGYFIVPKVVE